MREDTKTFEQDAIVDLGAATEVTQGTFLRQETEAVVIKDHYEP
ncbi:hypothetical protein [Vitreimonas flagellata]|nr:hypothetical protein [Vitreimonas flagellata]